MELMCRALLVYCVRHYKGDDKIKSFIWDLITPTKDGQNEALQNHSGENLWPHLHILSTSYLTQSELVLLLAYPLNAIDRLFTNALQMSLNLL